MRSVSSDMCTHSDEMDSNFCEKLETADEHGKSNLEFLALSTFIDYVQSQIHIDFFDAAKYSQSPATSL